MFVTKWVLKIYRIFHLRFKNSLVIRRQNWSGDELAESSNMYNLDE